MSDYNPGLVLLRDWVPFSIARNPCEPTDTILRSDVFIQNWLYSVFLWLLIRCCLGNCHVGDAPENNVKLLFRLLIRCRCGGPAGRLQRGGVDDSCEVYGVTPARRLRPLSSWRIFGRGAANIRIAAFDERRYILRFIRRRRRIALWHQLPR